MRWVTRERAKVDRIACPWLIKKFVDVEAEFLFVPNEEVLKIAKGKNAIAFDAPGAELTHYKEDGHDYVSFDAIVRKYGLKDKALLELARIIRGADTTIPDPPPESAGLEAAATGFRAVAKDDFENLELQFPLYDALYRYCQLKVQGAAGLEHAIR